MQRETKKKNMIQKYGKFKSTPSMQRETWNLPATELTYRSLNPLPLCRGRRGERPALWAEVEFKSTPSMQRETDAQIRCFNIQEERSVADASAEAAESLKGIKALKELLDMGAITQEEFDAKKNQLLNL